MGELDVKLRGILLALSLMALVPVAGFMKDEPPVDPQKDQAAVVLGNNGFALELYAKLCGREGNLFLSPFSISTALAMTYAGARGETEAQMAKVLHFALGQKRLHPAFEELITGLYAEKKKQGYQLVVANALWGQEGYGFLKEFLELTRTYYGAGLHELDFKGATEPARKTINTWVERKTKGKIKDLIKPGVLSALTRLVLTNAIYFKGDWASKFKEGETKESPFTLLSGKKVTVPMMNQTEEFKYMEDEKLQALELPYVGDKLSMVVFLPRKIDGLGDLEKSLTVESLSKWLRALRKRKVIVLLPKFKMTSEFGLADVLRSLGMTDAFSLPPADFSGMDGKKDLFISAVIHKAFVEVNEEGTEAAAATAVVMGLTAVMPEQPPVFRADHPFTFIIRETESNSILFMGRVSKLEGKPLASPQAEMGASAPGK